jgi:hypothetical protein
MTVPGRVAAAALLLSLEPPTWFVRHATAVAEVAAWLAKRVAAGGAAVDRQNVESGALLHDVDKILPADDPAGRLPHGDGSAAWLTRHGHGELDSIVAAHPVTRLLDGQAFGGWLASAPIEAKVVAYADKRAGQRLESMADRFASWERRYPDSWSAATSRDVWTRAVALERDVCGRAGVAPDEIGRLAWVAAALRRARPADAA